MRGAVVILLAAVAFIAASPASAAPSGIIGQVLTRTATGLGCTAGFRAPCFKPVAGVRVTFIRGGETLHATSDRLGRFKIALAPGSWTARAPGLMVAGSRPLVVRVPAGRFLRIALLVRAAQALR